MGVKKFFLGLCPAMGTFNDTERESITVKLPLKRCGGEPPLSTSKDVVTSLHPVFACAPRTRFLSQESTLAGRGEP